MRNGGGGEWIKELVTNFAGWGGEGWAVVAGLLNSMSLGIFLILTYILSSLQSIASKGRFMT
jgi:hypothetical protein